MVDIYFDNAATTKTSLEVANRAFYIMTEEYGNPSSLHNRGLRAEKEIKNTSKIISNIINSNIDEIYFTSGGTESNNIALFGTAKGYNRSGKHIITTLIEHPSIVQPFKALENEGFEITYLNVDLNGIIDIEQLKNSIRQDTILVSIMYVNNEIGSVQNIELIGKTIKEINYKILFHVDAVQAFGKYNMSVTKSKIDILSISGHKFHAPKGIGVLYIKKNLKVKPLIYGGGQQRNIRSGTENVPAISALAIATQQAYENIDNNYDYVKNLKYKLLYGILDNIEDTYINGSIEKTSPYILNITFGGIKSEILLHSLENEGINISSGSACSSHKKQLSQTLKAIGIQDDYIEGAVRFSFSIYNKIEEVEYCIDAIKKIVPILRKFKRS